MACHVTRVNPECGFKMEVCPNYQRVRIISNWPTFSKMCFVQHSCNEASLSCSTWQPQANTCCQIFARQGYFFSTPQCKSGELQRTCQVCACLKSLLQHAHWPCLKAAYILILGGRKESGWVNLSHGSYNGAIHLNLIHQTRSSSQLLKQSWQGTPYN